MTKVSKPRARTAPSAARGAAPKSAIPAATPSSESFELPAIETVPDNVPAMLAAAEPVATPAPAPPEPVAVAEPVAAAAPVVDQPSPVEHAIPTAAAVATENTEAVVAASTAAPIIPNEDLPMDTINTAPEAAATKAQALFTDMNARAKTAMEKSAKAFEDATEFNKANVEAVVESAKIAAKGFETLGQEAAEYGRKSFEQATAAMKSLSSVKSPTDFFKLQSDFVRSAFDAMVAESSRSTEAMLKLAGEVAQPISNRAALAVEKVKIAA